MDEAVWDRARSQATIRSAEAALEAEQANVDVLRAAAGRGRARRGRVADGGRQGRARPVLHHRPRAGRRRHRQQGGPGRLLRQGRHAAGRAGAAGQRPCRREFQGDAARPICGRARRCGSRVDAFPERDITGTVESIAPASGSVFSLLPPENATGNFTKIVQRVPVRIAVDPEVLRQGLLRPGLSVVATSTRAHGPAEPAQCCRALAAPWPPSGIRRCRRSTSAGWSPSSSWSSGCSWRSWTSRSSRPRCPRSRPACRPAPTRSPGSRPAT